MASAYRDIVARFAVIGQTPAPPGSVSCLATDLTCEVAGMLGGWPGRVQLPRSGCLRSQMQPLNARQRRQQVVQLTGDVEACVRMQRLPMNSGSSPDENHWGVPLPGRRKADLLETRPKTVIRRSHPGTSAPEGWLAGHKSGHGHFPQTR